MNKTSILFLYLLFINQAYAVDDCPSGQRSLSTVFVNTTPAVIIPSPKLCKPLDVVEFSVIKEFDSQDYELNWSKEDHEYWHVKNYEVRVNGTDVTSYDFTTSLPLNMSLALGNDLASFEIRACAEVEGITECGDWVSTATQCEIFCLDHEMELKVFEDQETSRRFIKWEKANVQDIEEGGVTHYKLNIYIENDFYESRSYPLDVELPVILNDLSPTTYEVSACTNEQCGVLNTTSLIQQGLGRVHSPEVNWSNLTNPNFQNFRLTFTFDYPASLVSLDLDGKPSSFKIVSDILQPNGSYELDVISFNGQTSYSSRELSYSEVTGNSFTILACNDYLGCGKGKTVSFGTPLSSADLPVPQWTSIQTFGELNRIIWNFGTATNEQIDNVDYIEVFEKQPHSFINGNYKRFTPAGLVRVFYIDDLNGIIKLNRQAIGRYKYQLRACKRDREFGDTCSGYSEERQLDRCTDRNYTGDNYQCVVSADVPNPYYGKYVNLDTITNTDWYTISSNKTAIKWSYDDSVHNPGKTPDYFYLTLETGAIPSNSSCSNKTNLQVEYADNILQQQNYVWTTEAVCDDIGETQWKVEACYNGAGCISDTQIVVDTSVPPGTGPIITDPNTLHNIIGGPSDMRSGSWWHPDLSGTGWHFYWANELRSQSDNPGQYNKTYDLIGYWFAYREVNGAWTPTWFEVRLKQDNLSQIRNDRLGYFEGNLLYRNGSDSTGTKTDVGHVKLYFEDPETGAFENNPKRAVLMIDADYSDGVFTRSEELGPYELTNTGHLKLNIEDFKIEIMQGNGNDNGNYEDRFGNENDVDFYSGMWQLNPTGNGHSELTMLTSIKRNFELTTFAFYDDDGEPIWVQGSSCGGASCDIPVEGQFEGYVGDNGSPTELTMGLIPYGFNPLGQKPEWFDFGDPTNELALYVGRGGRDFSVGDSSDKDRFNKASFWLDVDINLSYELEGSETYTRNIVKNFGQYTQTLEKTASLHGIGFEINDPTIQDEGWVCDPNVNIPGECNIKFHWFSDQDFSTIHPTTQHAIIPHYSYRETSGSAWSDNEPLSDLCGGLSTNTYIVAGFQCLIHTPGEYRFQLHKNTYNTSDNSTFPIAETEVLKIETCTQLQCQETMPLTSEAPYTGDVPDPENGSELVGTSIGQFQVDQQGQANYSIPILAGTSTAGVAPTVALNYSSASANGHLGVGWSISGVSIITRCRETQESRDGTETINPRPLSFSVGDKFCLGGDRLFAISGVYGESGTEYRTEMDQFARIISHGGSNNNPDYFTVERKDGSKSYYGNTVDSNITVDFDNTGTADSTYAWSINKYVDNMDNYINYSYYDFGNMEFAIKDINYTGNETQNLSPYNKISFYYENNRTDKYEGYVSGIKTKVSRRVSYITSLIDEQEVRRYIPTYQYSSKTGRSTMASIKECVGNKCLKPTVFDWTQVAQGFTVEKDGDFHSVFPYIKTSKIGDVNADGRSDLVYVDQDNVFKIALAGGYGGFCTEDGCGVSTDPQINAEGISEDKKWHLIDYNADGLMDLIKQREIDVNQYQWVVHPAVVTDDKLGFQQVPIYTNIFTHEVTELEILDVNGDGLSDILYISPLVNEHSTFSVRLLEPVPYQCPGGASSCPSDPKEGTITSYKFSDDALSVKLPESPSEFCYLDDQGNQQCDIQEVKDGFMAYQLIGNSYNDINADGMVDLILKANVLTIDSIGPCTPSNTTGNYHVFTSGESPNGDVCTTLHSSHLVGFESLGINGTDLVYDQIYQYIDTIDTDDFSGVLPSSIDLIKTVDINADGLTDLIYKEGINWKFRLATGLEFLPAIDFNEQVPDETLGKHIYLFDYNSDGFTDVIFPEPNAGIGSTNPFKAILWDGFGYSELINGIGAFGSDGDASSNIDDNFNMFMDFDGDGRTDHLRINNLGKQKTRLAMNNHTPIDKIFAVTNGLDARTQVKYVPMSFSTVYQKGDNKTHYDWGNGSPVMDMLTNMFVVQHIVTPSPSISSEGTANYLRYHYANARIQSGGRGFLGFGQITTMSPTETSTGVHSYFRTTTQYRQDFPYIGMAESTEVHLVSTELPADNGCNDLNDCFPEPCPIGYTCDPQRAGVVTETLMSRTENLLEHKLLHNKTYFPYVRRTFEHVYSPDSPEGDPQLLKRNEMWTVHDDYGNPLSNTIVVRNAELGEEHRTLQVNYFCNVPDPDDARGRCGNVNNSDKWFIGLLEISVNTVRQTVDGVLQEVTNRTDFDYDYTTGLKSYSYQEKTSTDYDKYLKTVHQYDDFGNEVKTITCSDDVSDCLSTPTSSDDSNPYRVHRYNRIVFDNKGRYVNEIYNSEEQRLSGVLTRNIYGSPLTSIDLLGRITTNNYDVFGRLISTRNTLGEWSTISRSWCEGLTGELACPSGMGLKVRTRKETSGGGVSYTYQDLIGREAYQVTQTFNTSNWNATLGNDKYTASKVWHDRYGRQIQSEGPYFIGTNSNIPITTTEYDKFNRPVRVTLADGSFESMTYEPFVVNKVNGLGQTKREKINELGQLIMVKDFNLGDLENPDYQNKLTYKYNVQGLVTQIKRSTTDELGANVVELLSTSQYDILGRKTSGSDVDTGNTSTIYNALGEMVQTTDAKGQVLNSYYDSLGRVWKTTSKAGSTLLTNTTFNYDLNNGLLLNEEKITYTGGLNLFYGTSHQYDVYNRASSSTVTFTDTDNLCDDGMSCVYDMAVFYDQYSRIKFQQDASGQAIQNHYNHHGFLSHVTKPYVISKEYYRIDTTDQWGNVNKDTRGGNFDLSSSYFYDAHRGWLTDIVSGIQNHHYEFDVVGNLQSRRKTAVAMNGTDPETDQLECFSYDRLNRLTRSYQFDSAHAGSSGCNDTANIIQDNFVSYDGRGNITEKDGQSYIYLKGSNTSITVSPHQVMSKGAQVFGYDANGNNILTTNFIDESGAHRDRHISYTAFDKIKKVWTTDNGGNELASSEYRYDIGENRFYRKDINSLNETSVIHFIGNVEILYPNGANKEMRRQLGNYAIIVERPGSQSISYLFNDHLGSVDVITDGYGNVLERSSFSAWGEKRTPLDWSSVLPSDQRMLSSAFTTSGFTGHEMNDAFGIVNMGGRIYDASLGRVLQADPFVQEPTNSQSYNRYTYVFNNPLSYTDPSGYITMRQGIGMVVGAVLTYFLGPVGAGIGNSIVGAALIGGFVGAYISTDGDISASVKAGFTAAVTAFVMDQMFKPKSSAAAGKEDEIFSNSFESSSPNMDSTTSISNQKLVEQSSNLVGNEVVNTAGDGSVINLDTITSTGSARGIVNTSYLRAELMIDFNLSSFIEALRKYYMFSNETGISNQLEVARDLDSVLNDVMPARYLSNQYDQLIYTGLDVADKVSMAVGVVGIARYAVARSALYLSARKMTKEALEAATKQCFVAGTLVHTNNGLKSIETIEEGELVLSKDDKTGEMTFKKVTQLFVNHDKEIYNLTTVNHKGEETVTGVTAEHPYWVKGKGWVDVKELQAGDHLTSHDGQVITVKAKVLDDQLHTTFNFEVEDFHTYFVGIDGIWVHNVCFPSAKELSKRLGVSEKVYHKQIKSQLKVDFKAEMKKINSTNPDFGVDEVGNIALKNPKTGKIFQTDVPLEAYKFY